MNPTDLTSPFDVTDIATLASECLCVTFGSIDRKVVDRLQDGGYDQAPVLNQLGHPEGLISTERLRFLLQNELILEKEDEGVDRAFISAQISVYDLVSSLANKNAVLVMGPSNASVWIGLLSLADLNRVLFRSMLYVLIARFETRLARLVEHHFQSDEWLDLLTQKRKDRIMSHWEAAKMQKVDLGITIGAEYSDLLNIVKKTPALLNLLDFRSGKSFNMALGRSVTLRNNLMHPVRLLVANQDELSSILPSAIAVSSTDDKVSAVLSKNRKSRPI